MTKGGYKVCGEVCLIQPFYDTVYLWFMKGSIFILVSSIANHNKRLLKMTSRNIAGTTHAKLSPINYKKGALDSQPQVIKFTSCLPMIGRTAFVSFTWFLIVSNPRLSTLESIDLIWFIVFNATFSNISAISWRSVLVVEEAGVPG
jgi:hypothetical protein